MALELAPHQDLEYGMKATSTERILGQIRATKIEVEPGAQKIIELGVCLTSGILTTMRLYDALPFHLGSTVTTHYKDIYDCAVHRERINPCFAEVMLHLCLLPEIQSNEGFWKSSILMLMDPIWCGSDFYVLGLRKRHEKRELYSEPMNAITQVQPSQRFLMAKKLPNRPRPEES